MHMHADPFAEDGRRKLHGQNFAAALLEGAFQRMESALREPSGEIRRPRPVFLKSEHLCLSLPFLALSLNVFVFVLSCLVFVFVKIQIKSKS